MLALISPAKKMNFESVERALPLTPPVLMDESETLIDLARKLTRADIKRLMDLSDNLAELNYQRFQDFKLPFTPENAKAAVLAFNGDTYAGLDAKSLNDKDLAFAQDHLRILSGLYGLLRPCDMIQAYRLEMGRKLHNPRGEDLYDFWGDRITAEINKVIKETGAAAVINLASQEYISAVKPGKLSVPMITPVFREIKDGQARVIGLMAKRARGMMARFIIQNRLEAPEALKDFTEGGYRFQSALSDATRWEFSRSA
jgi:hypothetical protein